MINKQGLWFLTLFSLILVLSVYYITMPNDLLIKNNNYSDEQKVVKEETKVTIKESDAILALKVSLEEERNKEIEELRTIMSNSEATIEEKNEAYEQIKYLTNLKGKEEELETKIKNNFKIDCFIKIDNNEIKVTAVKDKHDSTLANNIMRSIQEEYKNKMFITVKFEK